MSMKKGNWKDILVSVLIGAVVAFVTTFLEGALEYFNNTENNIVGGAAATLYRIVKHMV